MEEYRKPIGHHIKFIKIFKLVVAPILILSSLHAVAQDTLELRYFQNDVRYEYRTKLLALALTKTADSHGPFLLQPLPNSVTQARGLKQLEAGVIDVVSLGTNLSREKRFLPVRVPILSGLLGYRVLLINQDNADKFKAVNSIEDLRQLTAGFGAQWGDLKILEANDLKLETAAVYENLFKMLAARRYDYFPRGINEAWRELNENSADYPNMTIENHIALYYPFPTYFFVRKGNTALANRIEEGLTIALLDGSFKALFLQYHEADIRNADLANRRLVQLENPFLPKLPDIYHSINWLKLQ